MKGELDHYALWTGLLGGLALFLYGMDALTRALKVVAGNRLKDILGKLTANRFMGAITGAAVTAIVNSSSVTTVIMVGFVSAGLLSMAQCVGVIMGANIGSTMTAQILAFKVSKIALPMVTAGFLLWFLPKAKKTKQYGAALLGLGLVFYGMSVMSDAMRPLRSYEPFTDLMVTMDTRIWAVLVGAAFTGIIQSSAATTGIVIVMAGQGLVSLEAAISIALGANIGTCATAGLAVIGKPREAVRAAVVHVLFNMVGVCLWFAFVPQLADLVRAISPAATDVPAADAIRAAAPRQIANAHTIFNVVNTAIFIWFTSQIARVAEWVVPDKPLDEKAQARPKYLDDALLATPALALSRARMEIGRLGTRAVRMFEAIMPAVLTGTREELEEVCAMDSELDELHAAIIEYLRGVGVDSLTREQANEFVTLMKIANSFEGIGDVIETDLVNLGLSRIEEEVFVSQATLRVIGRFHKFVQGGVQAAVTVAVDEDADAADDVINMHPDVSRLADQAAIHGAKRLVANEPNRLAAYTREMEVVERIKRIYYFAKRVAETVEGGHSGPTSRLLTPGAGPFSMRPTGERDSWRPTWLPAEPPVVSNEQESNRSL